jgi:hypothetical protein
MIFKIQFIKNTFTFNDFVFWNKLIKEILDKENLIKQSENLDIFTKRIKCREFRALETESKHPLTEIQAQQIISRLKEKYDIFSLRTNGESMPKAIIPDIDKNFVNEELSKMYHNSWLNRKIGEGWNWGRVYSEIDKKHPMLLPWEQLPDRLKHVDNVYDKIKTIIGAK